LTVNTSRPSILLAGLLLLASATCAAQASRIVFERSILNSNGTLNSATLYRVNANGTGFMQLRPMTPGVYRAGGVWSPHGTYIVYVRGTTATTHDDLYVMTATGANPRRITTGSADHFAPAWRPDGGWIAYIAQGATGACLGLVRPDGTGQHNVFCPPGPAFIDRAPLWSADGTRIFLSTSFIGSGLEPPLFVRAYRVNPATGASTLLIALTTDSFHTRQIFFAPGGTHGLLASGWSDEPIDAVDFATDMVTPLTTGYAPVYSHDGSRFAYTKFGFTGAPTFYSFHHVWVMAANGSSDHEVTPALVNELEYVAVDWSLDDTRLLVNRTVYAPIEPGSGLYVGTPAMRIFNVATSAFTTLPAGAAEDWYQSP
jgi:Tol biopolymer transport system component